MSCEEKYQLEEFQVRLKAGEKLSFEELDQMHDLYKKAERDATYNRELKFFKLEQIIMKCFYRTCNHPIIIELIPDDYRLWIANNYLENDHHSCERLFMDDIKFVMIKADSYDLYNQRILFDINIDDIGYKRHLCFSVAFVNMLFKLHIYNG